VVGAHKRNHIAIGYAAVKKVNHDSQEKCRQCRQLILVSLTGVMNVKRLSFLAVLILGFCAAAPRLYGFVTMPPRVRFPGVLVLSKDQNRKGALEDLDVLIGKEKRIFLLDKMKIIGSVGVNRTMLQRLFAPLILFVGPDDLIRHLKSPNVVGRVLTIEGFLYPESRMLFITAVDNGEAAGRN
jgi:hypothetical protein